MTQSTTDVIGDYGGPHFFETSKWVSHYQALNCKSDYFSGGLIGYELLNFPCHASAPHSHLTIEDVPPYDGVDITSRTSPNRPLVDLPVMFAELKDLPGMLKQVRSWGDNIPEAIRLIKAAGESIITRKSVTGASSAYLGYTFGWKPLISDLTTLFGFAEAFERRRKELDRLWSGGLRRRIGLGEWSKEFVDNGVNYFDATYPFVCYGGVKYSTKITKWGTCQWHAIEGAPTTEGYKDLATTRSLLGLGLSPVQLWEIIPWSFLVDYFVPIGKYLESYRNTVPCFPSNVFVMTRTETQLIRTNVQTEGGFNHRGSGGGGSAVLTTKQRLLKTISPLPAQLPFLGAGQMSNIAALSISRRSAWR